jgi:hypothetical protein
METRMILMLMSMQDHETVNPQDLILEEDAGPRSPRCEERGAECWSREAAVAASRWSDEPCLTLTDEVIEASTGLGDPKPKGKSWAAVAQLLGQYVFEQKNSGPLSLLGPRPSHSWPRPRAGPGQGHLPPFNCTLTYIGLEVCLWGTWRYWEEPYVPLISVVNFYYITWRISARCYEFLVVLMISDEWFNKVWNLIWSIHVKSTYRLQAFFV